MNEITITGAILASLVLCACGLTVTQVQDRERCYGKAEAVAQARVDSECHESFSGCEAADDILAKLRAAQEACP
jgi:hypothetical protein